MVVMIAKQKTRGGIKKKVSSAISAALAHLTTAVAAPESAQSVAYPLRRQRGHERVLRSVAQKNICP